MKTSAGLPLGVSVLALLASAALLFHSFRDPSSADAAEPKPQVEVEPEPAPVRHRPAPRIRPTSRYVVPEPVATPTPITQAEALESPLALLPPNTLLAAVAPDYQGLMKRLGVSGTLARHSEYLSKADEALADLGLVLGDFVDPSSLGVAADQPMVLAVVGIDTPIVLLGATIADEERLDRAIETIASHLSLETEPLEDALYTSLKGERSQVAFLRRGGQVFVLISDSWRGRTALDAVAAQLAWQAPEESLVTTAAWDQAFQGVRGDIGWLFMSGEAFVAEAVAEITSEIDEQRQRLEAAEAALREAGQTDQKVIEQQLGEWQYRSLRTQQSGLAMFQAFFGGIGGVGFGFEFDGGALRAGGRMALEPGSLLARLTRNRGGDSALLRAIDSPPMFAMDGALDNAAMQEFVRLFASVIDADLERALILVKGFGAMDMEPMDLLSGEFGVAVMTAATEHGRPDMDFTATIGVTRADAAQKLINNLGGLATFAGMVKYDEQTGGINFEIPGWRTVHLALVDSTVILTTEIEHIDRLARRASPVRELTGNFGLDQLIGRTGQAGLMMMDYAQFMDLVSPSYYYETKASEMAVAEDATEEQRRLAAINHELQLLYAEDRKQERARMELLKGIVGHSAMTAQAGSDEMRFDAGWFTPLTTPEDAFAALLDWAVAEGRASDSASARKQALWDEQAAIHARVAAEAAAGHAP